MHHGAACTRLNAAMRSQARLCGMRPRSYYMLPGPGGRGAYSIAAGLGRCHILKHLDRKAVALQLQQDVAAMRRADGLLCEAAQRADPLTVQYLLSVDPCVTEGQVEDALEAASHCSLEQLESPKNKEKEQEVTHLLLAALPKSTDTGEPWNL